MKARTNRARRLRRDATEAERLLWWRLCEAQLPWKFRRQHPIDRYVVDFAVVGAKLAIEVDGGQHGAKADAQRTNVLGSLGWRVIRFWNNDVMTNTDAVIDEIVRQLRQRPTPTSPVPSPLKGGGGPDVGRETDLRQ